MKLLNKYFDLQKEIYEYFGYVEDWVVIPIDDAREYYWCLEQDENGYGSVGYSSIKEQVLPGMKSEYGDDFYSNEIYTQRFLPKWVYEGEEYTMICVDTCTDGNKYLQIFDNKKNVRTVEKESEDK